MKYVSQFCILNIKAEFFGFTELKVGRFEELMPLEDQQDASVKCIILGIIEANSTHLNLWKGQKFKHSIHYYRARPRGQPMAPSTSLILMSLLLQILIIIKIIKIIEIFMQVKNLSMPKGTVINNGPVLKKYTVKALLSPFSNKPLPLSPNFK